MTSDYLSQDEFQSRISNMVVGQELIVIMVNSGRFAGGSDIFTGC